MEGPTERIVGGIIATVVGGLILFIITRPAERVRPIGVDSPVVRTKEQPRESDRESGTANNHITADPNPPSDAPIEPDPRQGSTAPSLVPDAPSGSRAGVGAVPPTAPYPVQQSPADGGVQVTLESLNNTTYRLVATIRITNRTDSEIGVALLSEGAFRADVTLVDNRGGTCQMAANGEGWGTLDAYSMGWGEFGLQAFSIIPRGQSARHTLFFNKGRCDTQINSTTDLAIRGTLAVRGETIRTSTFSFENLPLVTR
ncbi:MAG: hypothetical protein QOH04_2091 [Sphingomonadales bacterium]|jgi:hypothetical protein|nr:hypothetical protein [Sphingomonadales bacterium]